MFSVNEWLMNGMFKVQQNQAAETQFVVKSWVSSIRKTCTPVVSAVNPNPLPLLPPPLPKKNDLVRDSEIKKVKPADH